MFSYKTYAARGAITVEKDTAKEIIEKSCALISEMVKANNIDEEEVISLTISTTTDIHSYYPAKAVRESGIIDVPLFSCIEPEIDGALKLCIRMILHFQKMNLAFTAKHIYLGGATALRPDLAPKAQIAIDGPSGAGKSTIARALSKKLNITYLDTGAMYRAAALKADISGIDVKDEKAVKKMLKKIDIQIKYLPEGQLIFLDGKDVSGEIRKHHISKMASDISALKPVRLYMVDLQRKLAGKNGAILDGRDIGTFVLPNADYKFFLTASADERAKRRYEELKAKGENCVYDEIKSDIENRDKNDMTREFAPLKKADDAIEIDSTYLNVDEVVEKIYNIIKQH